jgi:hypothetical protein
LKEPYIEGVGNEPMADGYLFHTRKFPDSMKVIRGKIVTCIDLQARIKGGIVTVSEPGKFGIDLRACLSHGIGAREELNTIGADCRGSLHKGGLRLHKEAYPNPACLEPFNSGQEKVLVSADIPAVVRGDLTGFGGNEGTLCGLDLHDQIEQVRSWIALDVVLNSDHGGQITDIAGADVAPVCSRMHGDALAPGFDAGTGGPDHVRLIASPGIP